MDEQTSSLSQQFSRGYVIAILSAAVLSTTAIFIRYLTETFQIPALVLAFWRDVFVVLTLLICLGVIRPGLIRVKQHHLSFLILYGLMLAIFNALWTLSVAENGASIATVLVYSSAAFTAVLGWGLLDEKLSWMKFLAVGLTITGCALVAGVFDQVNIHPNLPGVLAGILSGLFYSIYSLMGRTAAMRGLNPWTTLLYTFGFAALFLIGINLLPVPHVPGTASQMDDMLWLEDAWSGWFVLILLAAGPTVAGFGLYNVSLNLLPSSVANLIMTLEPVFTTAIAYILLGERLLNTQIIGGLLIMVGVVALRTYGDDRDRQTGQVAQKP